MNVNVTFRRVALGLAFLLYHVDVGATSSGPHGVSSLLINIVPPPAADLALVNLTMPVASPYGPDDDVTCDVTFSNIGAEAGTGTWCFTIFASLDDRLDSTDLQLGESCVTRTTLLPSTTLHHIFSVKVGALRAGPQRLICIANSRRTFPELQFDNNIVISHQRMIVDVPFIGPVPTLVTLTPGKSFLARMVAVGGVGLTVNASSNLTVQTAFNKVFLRHGSPPRLGQFDVSHSNPFASSHVLTIAAPKTGEYYMLFEADSYAAAGVQNMTFTAFNSTFSLDSISPTNVGRNGNVTIRLRGRELRSSMKVYIEEVATNSVRDALAVYDPRPPLPFLITLLCSIAL